MHVFISNVASDNFVPDLANAKITMYIRDEIDGKEDTDDPIIAFWKGDFVKDILGKDNLPIHFKQYSEHYVSFEELPDFCSITVGFGFCPVKLDVELSDSYNTGILHLDLLSASDLPSADSNGLSDPYAIVYLNGKEIHKTKTKKKTLNPEFDEGLEVEIFSRLRSTITVEIKDFNQFSSHVTLGVCTLALASLQSDQVTTKKVKLDKAKSGSVTLRYMFEPRRLNKKASKALETDGRFQTETSSLGKLGRGLTSQVTGLGKNLFGSKSTRGSSELVPPDSQKATVVNELDAAPAKRELPTRRPMRPAEGTSSTVSATPSTVNSTSTTNVAAAKPDNVVTNVDDYKPSKPINGTASVESIPAIPDTTPTTGLAIDKKSSRLSLASISDKASVYSQQSRIEDGEGYLIRILGAKDLKPVDSGGTSDPYVKVSVSGSDKKSMYKTAAQKKTLNPVWEKEWFMVSAATTLKFSIVDKNVISSNVPLGHVLLPIATVFGENDKFDDWFKIQEGTGSLHLAGEIGKRNALEGKKTLFKRSRDFSVS